MVPPIRIGLNYRSLFLYAIYATVVLVVIRLFLRRTVRTAKIKRWWRLLSDRFHEHQLLKVPELDDADSQENQLYRRLSLYLNSLESLEDSNLTNLIAGPTNPTEIALSLDPNQPLDDEFLGARLRWIHQVEGGGGGGGERRAFVLRIRKRDKRRILRPYLQHIHAVSVEIEESRSKEIRLFTNCGGDGERWWRSVPFTHPATIETIAMDADVKTKVKADLESFLKSKQYYHRLGRAWRRSYLLYGPSGTGKSSFVAAMARFLSYDVYDVDLSKVYSDSDLKLLLLHTTNRSVILIEDFDRYVASTGKSTSPVSISGVLNFMDGVVNSCCDGRVMVFTMTTKDGIDPSLLRPGRVDVHIHFPMCDFNNFKSLASNYLGVRDHKLFPMVEEMFQSGFTLSPAEIGELMVVNRTSPSRALKSVITAMQTTGGDGRGGSGKSGLLRRGGGASSALEAGRESVDSLDSAMVGCKDGVKEFRKFYGLLRRKSTKKSGPLDFDT